MGSTVRHDGGAGNNIKNRLNKARHAFRILNKVWRSSHYSTKTKLRRSEDLPKLCDVHLLYGFECWRMTESDITKLSVFHTKNLRRILQIVWPNTISNYSPAAIKTAWRLSSWEGDVDGLGTSRGESRTTSLAQPLTRHLKESARGEDQETPGAELWRQSSRPCNTLGVPSRSWPGTDRRGDSS